jgi:hypothetical protein
MSNDVYRLFIPINLIQYYEYYGLVPVVLCGKQYILSFNYLCLRDYPSHIYLVL